MNLQIFLNMFITAVCFLFLIKLRWPKNKCIHENKFLMNYSRSITMYSQSGYTKKNPLGSFDQGNTPVSTLGQPAEVRKTSLLDKWSFSLYLDIFIVSIF